MGDLHKYLEETFPAVYERLQVEKVQEYGLLITWKGKNEKLKPIVLMARAFYLYSIRSSKITDSYFVAVLQTKILFQFRKLLNLLGPTLPSLHTSTRITGSGDEESQTARTL